MNRGFILILIFSIFGMIMVAVTIAEIHDRYILKTRGIYHTAVVKKILSSENTDLKKSGAVQRTVYQLCEYQYGKIIYIKKNRVVNEPTIQTGNTVSVLLDPQKPSRSKFLNIQQLKIVDVWLVIMFIIGLFFSILLPWYIIAAILEKK